jgi:hypothetical protein
MRPAVTADEYDAEPPQIFTNSLKANTISSLKAEWHHFHGYRGNDADVFSGLASTPGGSTRFRGYSSDWPGAGVSARRTPSNLGQKLCPMANTLSLRGLNGITPSSSPWLGGDADVCLSVRLRLQGVRLDSKLANGVLFRVVIGWGHFLAPNPLKSSPALT